MKADLDYVEHYVQNQAEVKYGVDFEALSLETQEQLYMEAEADFYEAKVSEAEAIAESIKDEKMIDEFIETQAEAQREIKNGWV